VTDGTCDYDPATQTLFHFPGDDTPGATNTVTIRRPTEGAPAAGWRYFVKDGRMVSR
jgi:hypothetical protein